jgi:hypothetical protein
MSPVRYCSYMGNQTREDRRLKVRWNAVHRAIICKRMVPEVGIPPINSEQAHRHGVEAPRDFESRPDHQAISHHL